MADVDKIMCYDRPDTSALINAMNNNGGMGNMWNNPFAYFLFMYLFRMWGGENGVQGAEIQAKLNNLQAQMTDNHNNDLLMQAVNGNHSAIHELSNNLNANFRDVALGISNIQSAIQAVGGQVGMSAERVVNSVILGNKDLTQALQSCCCENKQLVMQMGYEGQIRDLQNTNNITSRIDTLANGVQTGFASIGNQNERNTAAIIQNATAQTQRILDQMCSNTTQQLRDNIAEKDRELLAANIVNQLRNSGSCGCNC